MQHELGILGAGNMAEAMVRSLLGAGVYRPEQVIAADISPERRALFSREMGVATVERPGQAGAAKILLLSVKPQQMPEVLAELQPAIDPQVLLVSIAAGVTTQAIADGLGGGSWRIVRAMPNTPMLVGEGMVGICAGGGATSDDLATARRLFEPAARVVEVPEAHMDAVTALSGSGPAYFFYLVEQMTRAGVELGLPAEQAHLLAATTARGAARMMLDSPDSPQELRRKVTSPGGTTQAAIEILEQQQVGEAIVAALLRAAARSAELSSPGGG